MPTRAALRGASARRHVCKSYAIHPVVKERVLLHREKGTCSTLYLIILFCPILVIFPLLAIVWILAPYFIEQWKEDWRAARERDRKLKEMAKLCENERI